MPTGTMRSVIAQVQNLGKKKIKKINSRFIRENYQKDFEGTLKNLLYSLSSSNQQFKIGYTQIYIYYADLERRGLDITQGWEYLFIRRWTQYRQPVYRPGNCAKRKLDTYCDSVGRFES